MNVELVHFKDFFVSSVEICKFKFDDRKMIKIIEQKHKAHHANKAQQAQKANQVHLEQRESLV
jgi:hypothetical protein